MIGGGKSTQRVREWVKRSNSSRTESKSKAGRSSSNSGHQTLEIIHLGGGRLESNGHIHSASLSANFLAPTSHQTRSSRANSIDSRVTQWSDLYNDPPESLTVITKPATATGKPSRPVSPELHERPQLRDLGSSHGYGESSRRENERERERERESHQHRHTKSDGSIHPAPLRIPSNSSSSSSIDKKDGGAAVTKPEETYKGQTQGQAPGLTRSNSKWKPLPVPPPPGAPGSVTPLVNGNERSEDNINMSGAIGVSPLTSVDMSESEFGEREDTPRQQQQQDRYGIQRGESRDRKHSLSNDASALGIGYAVGLGVLSPPLTPPEHGRAELGYPRDATADQEPVSATKFTYGIRESIWPVPPSYAQPQSAPSRSATAPPEQQQQRQRQHQQKPSTSSSLASIASSQSVPTHIIPKRSDSLSYSRNRRPQHAPQLSTSTSSSSSARSTEKNTASQNGTPEQGIATTASFAHGVATRIDTISTATAATAATASTPPIPARAVQAPPIPAPAVSTPPVPTTTSTVLATTAAVPAPEPKTPTWSPRSYLSSKEMLWLHRNYRGVTPFFSAWGLFKGLNDEVEREEGLVIMRELIAAEEEGSSKVNISRQARGDEENGSREGSGGDDEGGEGGDKSWLEFSPGPGDKRRTEMRDDEKDNEGKGSNGSGYAALKGQGVRMKPRGDPSKERRRVVNEEDEEGEGSDFF
ncbi:hypothetical protein B0T20DRAFT_344546 [Sordaria brevicollis]|uniref:Uncharacterized protein n=1 Tax=Sordaria brevicollis TaxID=83679 RepID=A0AAE0UGI0_SORBR|nr:hypothetical protein B0T20DRAFT_344546 [Sordaria brevicollis]